MFSTLKRRVKKIMEKVEEVIDRELYFKKKIYEDAMDNKLATGASIILGGIAIGAWFIISELTNNKRGD